MTTTNQPAHERFDVLSVGDIVTDAFIKLRDDQAEVIESGGSKKLVMPFATKVPYDHAVLVEAVGNASNASVNFAKLGLNSGLVTNIGNDQHGRDMIVSLEKKKVDTRFVKVNSGKPTNLHYVLWYKEERTILVNGIDYPYHWPHLRPDEVPKWLYFSSVSEFGVEYHDRIVEWLSKHDDVKLAFQPGTFQMKLGAKRLSELYRCTDVLALNREEAVLVTGGDYHNLHDLFDRLHGLGPKIVLISDGPAGSYASDGENRWKMPIYPDVGPPVERTGCGDAYTSTFVAALIKGFPLEGALQLAPIPPASVVQYPGAQEGLLTMRELKDWLERAPKWYRPERMER